MRSRKLEALKESGPVASLAAPVDPAPLARPVATPARSEKPQRKQREVFSDAQPRSILFGSKNTPKIQTRLWRHGTPNPSTQEHRYPSFRKLPNPRTQLRNPSAEQLENPGLQAQSSTSIRKLEGPSIQQNPSIPSIQLRSPSIPQSRSIPSIQLRSPSIPQNRSIPSIQLRSPSIPQNRALTTAIIM